MHDAEAARFTDENIKSTSTVMGTLLTASHLLLCFSLRAKIEA
jgi:hypothetical protein